MQLKTTALFLYHVKQLSILTHGYYRASKSSLKRQAKTYPQLQYLCNLNAMMFLKVLFILSLVLNSVLSECPQKSRLNCSCLLNGKWLELSCVAIHLKAIPQFVDLMVRRLDLSDNDITSLDTIHDSNYLQNLILHNNHISALSDAAFREMSNLNDLDLSNNEIAEISEITFHPLVSLKSLDLSDNQLTLLPGNLFDSQSSLETLSLAGNQIKTLKTGLFDDVIRLSKLNLSRNRLYLLPENLFTTNLFLSDLDLSFNQFNTFPILALQEASNLRKLLFDGNFVKKLDHKSFPDLNHLTELSISQSDQLNSIEELTFSPLCSLEKLIITGNPQLNHIDHDAFFNINEDKNCSNLKYLDLSNNKLTTLDSKTLPFCRIDEVNLSNNPWKCNCSLKWILDCPKLRRPDLV